MNKRTAIILINWNSYDCTADCLESLRGLVNKDYDVLLVDNGSADGSGKRLHDDFPEVIYIPLEKNIGFTGGNNAGMNYSINRDYEYTILLNNDTFVEPDFLKILTEYLDNHPAVGAIQPKIYYNHDRTLLWNAGSYFTRWNGKHHIEGEWKKSTPTSEIIKQPDWLTGCALMVRNDVIRQVGLLDESLFIYYDDLDYSFRIKNAGHQLVYHPGSVIYHIAGASHRSEKKGKEGFISPMVHYYLTRNRIWFIKKYLSPFYQFTALMIFAPYLAAMLGYFLMRRRTEKFKKTWQAVREGFSKRMETRYTFDKTI